MFVTVWQWAARGQEGFVVKSSGVESWPSPGPTMWSLLRGVERRPLSRLARGWRSRAVSVAGSGAESWPLLWPAREW